MLAPGRAVFSELLALNRREVDAFNGIVDDYLAGLQMIRELQVRSPLPPGLLLPQLGPLLMARICAARTGSLSHSMLRLLNDLIWVHCRAAAGSSPLMAPASYARQCLPAGAERSAGQRGRRAPRRKRAAGDGVREAAQRCGARRTGVHPVWQHLQTRTIPIEARARLLNAPGAAHSSATQHHGLMPAWQGDAPFSCIVNICAMPHSACLSKQCRQCVCKL